MRGSMKSSEMGLDPNRASFEPLLEQREETHGLRRAMRVFAAVLVPLLLLVGLFGLASAMSAPRHLNDGHLVGSRAPVPMNVVVLLDESGSFAQYASMRSEALAQLWRWVPDNLRQDDRITVLGFAAESRVMVPTTTVGEVAQAAPIPASGRAEGGSTEITPVLSEAVASVPAGMTTSLIVVTDTKISSAIDQTVVDELIGKLNATTMSVVTPSDNKPRAEWRQAFPWEAQFTADADDADQIAVAMGNALAHATNQRFKRL